MVSGGERGVVVCLWSGRVLSWFVSVVAIALRAMGGGVEMYSLLGLGGRLFERIGGR